MRAKIYGKSEIEYLSLRFYNFLGIGFRYKLNFPEAESTQNIRFLGRNSLLLLYEYDLATLSSNLLLGEKWDLKNRYLHINATKQWSCQPNLQITDGGVNGGDGSVNGGVNPEELMLRTITKNPGCNAPTLSTMLQMRLRTMQRQLKALKAKDNIEFRGAPKNGGYWPVD